MPQFPEIPQFIKEQYPRHTDWAWQVREEYIYFTAVKCVTLSLSAVVKVTEGYFTERVVKRPFGKDRTVQDAHHEVVERRESIKAQQFKNDAGWPIAVANISDGNLVEAAHTIINEFHLERAERTRLEQIVGLYPPKTLGE